MKNDQYKEKIGKKSSWNNIIIILLIAIIIATASIGVFAWARLREKASGTATAQVARWSFKLVDGVVETTDVIDFAVTRTDENTSVATGNLAPGTYGEFEIGIDATGTETILEYDIEIVLGDKPTNLKLYKDSERTNEILVEDNIFALNGFMSLEDVNEIKVEKIYWEWPYQTGETEEEQLENDLKDTEFLGKTMTMEIAVTGTEILEKTIYLADVVEVGDYVNYDASSNGIYAFSKNDCLDGIGISYEIRTEEAFYDSAVAQWRVLSVNRTTKTVELMATEPTQQTVSVSGGANSFLNYETVLNNIGAIYGHGKGAISGRSITLEDIEQYSSYNPYTYTSKNSSTGYYGGVRAYTSGEFYEEIRDEQGNIIGYETTPTTASSSNQVTMTHTEYRYTAESYFSNTTIYNMFFKRSTDGATKSRYYIASRGAYLEANYCSYYVHSVFNGYKYSYPVYYSNGSAGASSASAVPVVLLQPKIQTTGQDENEVWQLKVE